MDESTLRGLLDQVKRGHLSRRLFLQAMAALGIGAPLAAQMLAAAGVAAAEPRRPFVPSRRGGGGTCASSCGTRRPCSIRTSGAACATSPPRASSTSPWPPHARGHLRARARRGDPDAGQRRHRPGRAVGHLEAQAGCRLARRRAVHRGRRRLQLGVCDRSRHDGHAARAAFEDVARIDRVDSHTVKVVFKKPQPFWDRGLHGRRPRSPATSSGGTREPARARRSAWSSRSGTGPYELVEFKPGDLIRAEINPTYHVPNRPYFDRLEIKCGGDAPSAGPRRDADRRVRLRVLHPGGGGGPPPRRAGRQGPHRHRPGARGQPHPVQPDRPVARGGRRAVEPPHDASLPGRPDGAPALSLLVDRASIQEHLVGRTGQITAELPQRAGPVPLAAAPRGSSTSTRPTRSSTRPAGRAARTASAPRTASGSSSLFQAGAPIPPSRRSRRWSSRRPRRAGIEIEVKAVQASVFFPSDVNNPDTNVRFLADLQTYTTFTSLDPQMFMAQFVSWEIPVTGEQVDRAEHRPLAERGVRPALAPGRRRDGPRQARGALHPHERPGGAGQGVVIPITWRNVLHAAGNSARGHRAPMAGTRSSAASPTGTAQAADEGPSASLAPSAAGSTYSEYASPAAFGRRLAYGPSSAACRFSPTGSRHSSGPGFEALLELIEL